MEINDEILDIPFKPWEYITYTEKRFVIRRHYSNSSGHAYDATFETLKNYDRSLWKPGDIVKFGNGYNSMAAKRWESWFLSEKDKDKFMKKHKYYDRKIPAYARNQYAIVLARYKWTKYKGYSIFRDYGTFIMMLTGSKVGYIRKYYITCPYQYIARYPYSKILYNLNHEKLFHGVGIEEDKTIFLENLVRKLTNEN